MNNYHYLTNWAIVKIIASIIEILAKILLYKESWDFILKGINNAITNNPIEIIGDRISVNDPNKLINLDKLFNSFSYFILILYQKGKNLRIKL